MSRLSGGWRPLGRPTEVSGASRCRSRRLGRRGGSWRASGRAPFFSEGGRRPRWPRTACSSSCEHCSECVRSYRLWIKLRFGRQVRDHRFVHAFQRRSRSDPCVEVVQSKNTHYKRLLSTIHDLHRSDYFENQPEHRVQAVRGHRGRRPRVVVLTFEHLLCCTYRSLYPTPRPRVGVRTFKHLPSRRC